MNEKLVTKERSGLTGESTLRGWKPGVIQFFMDKGLDLAQAKTEAIAAGALLYESKVSNLVVTTGRGLVGDYLLNMAPNGLLYHAIGTGAAAPALADIALGTEVRRKVWTLSSRTGAVVSFSVFYTAAECTFNLTEAGTFGGAATAIPGSGTLFSRYLQPKDNHVGSMDLTYDYDITIGD